MALAPHKPERSCVACKTATLKSRLVRIVRQPQGSIALDTTGRTPGRGAYVCANAACLQKALSTNLLQRALRMRINADALDELKLQIDTVIADASVRGGSV